MYIPKYNLLTDQKEIADFISRFSFGLVVTLTGGRPVATHLPFVVSREENTLGLASHFARANAQWKDIEDQEMLIVFSEPHAYISPSHYEKALNVPTWNYVAVHVYGRGTIVYEEEKVTTILERTIKYYEPEYLKQWDGLPVEYKTNLSRGIVAFEVRITDIQGKKKLSQNKTKQEQTNIIHALSKSTITPEQLVADYMKKELEELHRTKK